MAATDTVQHNNNNNNLYPPHARSGSRASGVWRYVLRNIIMAQQQVGFLAHEYLPNVIIMVPVPAYIISSQRLRQGESWHLGFRDCQLPRDHPGNTLPLRGARLLISTTVPHYSRACTVQIENNRPETGVRGMGVGSLGVRA